MTNFNKKLRRAMGDHYRANDEVITNVYVANKLWANSPYGSRRSLMSKATTKGVDLKVSQIRILLDIFTETTAQYWVNDN
jgi:hypothetical protein